MRLSVGKEESIRPADLVGAIAGEAGVPSRVIGAIKIHDDYSLVEVPEELAERIIEALRRTKIRGNKVTVPQACSLGSTARRRSIPVARSLRRARSSA